MNYAKKQNINVAVSNNNKFNLTKKVVTTSDFGRIKPLECRLMVPGDSFNYKVSSITRLLPMPSPTLGRIEVIQRAYFIPIRTILPYFNDYISGNRVYIEGAERSVKTPVVQLGHIYSFFTKSDYSTKVADDVSTDKEYDFYLASKQGYSWSTGCYKFTPEGRKDYDFMLSLGLNIPFNSAYVLQTVSVLPFIAYWKTYKDWVVPSRFVTTDDSNAITDYINSLLPPYDKYTVSGDNVILDEDFFEYLCRPAIPYFSNDFFTSAWQSPYVDSSKEVLPRIKVDGVSYIATNTELNSNPDDSGQWNTGARVVTNSGTNAAYLRNYYSIETLGRLQDYLNRGLLAGSKIQDWLLSEFGMRPSTDALNLTTYLGQSKHVIRIGDVMSNADTYNPATDTGAMLGQFAGKGVADNVDNFSYTCKEHGFFLITSEIIPETSYYQGLIPEFQLSNRLDFFQPEFDSVGVEAISRKQLFFDVMDKFNYQDFNPDAVFGFTPRYSKLKTAFDVVSGDFRIPSISKNLKSWWLGRDMQGNISTAWINAQFAKLDPAIYNWDYIFQYQGEDVDHFYHEFLLENSASRPMKSLEDAFNPEHPNGSKDVTVNANGNLANN